MVTWAALSRDSAPTNVVPYAVATCPTWVSSVCSFPDRSVCAAASSEAFPAPPAWAADSFSVTAARSETVLLITVYAADLDSAASMDLIQDWVASLAVAALTAMTAIAAAAATSQVTGLASSARNALPSPPSTPVRVSVLAATASSPAATAAKLASASASEPASAAMPAAATSVSAPAAAVLVPNAWMATIAPCARAGMFENPAPMSVRTAFSLSIAVASSGRVASAVLAAVSPPRAMARERSGPSMATMPVVNRPPQM